MSRFVVATRDIEPLELVMWDNAAALGPRMGTAPVCLQVIVVVVMVMVMVMVMAGPGSHLICLLYNPKHFFLAVSEASGRELHVP